MASSKELKALITLSGKVDPSLQSALLKAQKGTADTTMKLSKLEQVGVKALNATRKAAKATAVGLAALAVSGGAALWQLGKEGIETASNLAEVQNVVDVTLAFDVISMDPKYWYDKMIRELEQEIGETLYPGDERRIVAEELFYIIMSIANFANARANAQLIVSAVGDDLEALGALLGVSRLPASAATVTMKFTVAAPAGETVVVPAGTRVTADGKLFFATMEQTSAAYDVGSVDIDTIALTAGAAANDISAGSITTLVDPIPYISAVTNSAAPSGGSDIEDDDSLRRRIMLAPHSFSSAGAAKSYEYWARTADPAVADAKAASPSAGVVNVTVLMDGGKIPTAAQLKAVENVLSAQTVRPLGIQVNVVAAEAVSYTATAKYYISSDDTAEINAIKSRVESAYADYLVWQKAVLGRAINPDELRRRLLTAGANRVDLSSPQWTTLDDDQVAAESTSSALTYGGTL